METPPASRSRDLVAAVLASAAFALGVALLPARGLTFLWDDWTLLARIQGPWPGSWLAPVNEHVKPLYVGLFHLEHAVFGVEHAFFLATTFAIHVANVALLGLVLERRTKDPRAAALAAAAFGVALTYREVLWWASLGGLALSFTIVLAGFLAFERAREGKSALPVALAVLGAPLAFGSGLALGPALALEAALAPRDRRGRLLVATIAPWLLYLGLYVAAGPSVGVALDHRALVFALDAVGLGIVRRNLLLPFPDEPFVGISLALAYFAWVAVVARALPRDERRRHLLAQAYLAFVVIPIALARAAKEPAVAAAWSRYQYFPALGWTVALAFSLSALSKRAPRLATGAALVGLALLATGHGIAARADTRPYSPNARASHAEVVRRLVAAAGTREPIYDAPLPVLMAWPGTRVRDVVSVHAPALVPRWTNERAPQTLAPYAADPVLEPLFAR